MAVDGSSWHVMSLLRKDSCHAKVRQGGKAVELTGGQVGESWCGLGVPPKSGSGSRVTSWGPRAPSEAVLHRFAWAVSHPTGEAMASEPTVFPLFHPHSALSRSSLHPCPPVLFSLLLTLTCSLIHPGHSHV